MSISAYAVAVRGEIIVKTVSESRCGALINWLYAEAHILVTNKWTAQMVEKAWEFVRESDDFPGVEIHHVEISIGDVSEKEVQADDVP